MMQKTKHKTKSSGRYWLPVRTLNIMAHTSTEEVLGYFKSLQVEDKLGWSQHLVRVDMSKM